jgi:hypothetical protein
MNPPRVIVGYFDIGFLCPAVTGGVCGLAQGGQAIPFLIGYMVF